MRKEIKKSIKLLQDIKKNMPAIERGVMLLDKKRELRALNTIDMYVEFLITKLNCYEE